MLVRVFAYGCVSLLAFLIQNPEIDPILNVMVACAAVFPFLYNKYIQVSNDEGEIDLDQSEQASKV